MPVRRGERSTIFEGAMTSNSLADSRHQAHLVSHSYVTTRTCQADLVYLQKGRSIPTNGIVVAFVAMSILLPMLISSMSRTRPPPTQGIGS